MKEIDTAEFIPVDISEHDVVEAMKLITYPRRETNENRRNSMVTGTSVSNMPRHPNNTYMGVITYQATTVTKPVIHPGC